MVDMAVVGGRAVAVSSFPSSSYFCRNVKPLSSTISLQMVCKSITLRGYIACSAVQETSTSAVADETKEVKTEEKEAPAKPKPAARAAKAPAKPLPQMMEEDLEGSFIKKGNIYSFWAFFPNGVLTGPKGFSLSSYGSEASTVEPFLIDEKKITSKHVVFWIEKRLAAQGIIPVWQE
ncbi:hypothetical protein Pint_03165 [Pistacia integerrima]|uniref:Uncharacterized protein n=1 Tax=Pistacia integerrima TaxID=434235 RepID=A0ACC0ZM85_9ROSI|nr:hypothetical protein Pint_03165 [Pistacia integerrima]